MKIIEVERGTLRTGDYSLDAMTGRIAIERKSLDDLAGALTAGRGRFARECERGRSLDYFGLVIEGSLDDIRRHRYQSLAKPQCLLQTLTAWSIRYRCHVHFCGDRAGGEYMTYSLLDKYIREIFEGWRYRPTAPGTATNAP